MVAKYQNCALALEEGQQRPLPGLGALTGHTRRSGTRGRLFLTAHVHGKCARDATDDEGGGAGGRRDGAAKELGS